MPTIAERIKEALSIRDMKQADLSEKTKIGKSSISTYLSGDYEPKQKNLYKIAKVLNVNEAWLMGYDVPMEKVDSALTEENAVLDAEMSMDADFKQVFLYWKQLNNIGKRKALEQIGDLCKIYSNDL